MATAKDLKHSAAAARRTATALLTTAEQAEFALRWPNDPKKATISEGDIETLRKAAGIMNSIGSKDAKAGKVAAAQQDVYERKKAKALEEVRKIIDTWPTPANVLDRVALVTAYWGSDRNLTSALNADGQLNENAGSVRWFYEDALRAVPDSLADKAVTSGKPIADLVAEFRIKLDEIRQRPATVLLAQRIEQALAAEKMVQEQQS